MATKSIPAGAVQTTFPRHAEAVTPSDTTEFEQPSTVYAGVAGNVAVRPIAPANADVVIFAVPEGGFVPVLVDKVMATNTTATGLVRVY